MYVGVLVCLNALCILFPNFVFNLQKSPLSWNTIMTVTVFVDKPQKPSPPKSVNIFDLTAENRGKNLFIFP